MNIGGLLLITIAPIVLMIVVFFVSRAVFKIFMAVATVVFVLSLIVGGFLIYDAYRFSADLEHGQTRFTLVNETAAIRAGNGTIHDLNRSELNASPNGSEFLVPAAFLAENATVDYGEATVGRETGLSVIRSDDPYGTFAAALAAERAQSESERGALVTLYEQRLKGEYGPIELKSYVFGQLLASTLDARGPDALILAIRNGEVSVVPNRPVLTFIRIMPKPIITQALSVQVN